MDHQQQLRRLAARQQDKLEKQLKTIATELQEDFGQQLAAMRLELARVERRLAVTVPDIDIQLQPLHKILDSTISGLRQLSQQMRPPMLDELGLCSAIDQLREMTANRYGLVSDFQCHCAQGRINPEAALTIFRLIQEAVANVTQHAKAGFFSVQLSHPKEEVIVTVLDDGRGLPDPFFSQGCGILSMHERALIWGGSVEIRNGNQGGTVMEARFPSDRVLLD